MESSSGNGAREQGGLVLWCVLCFPQGRAVCGSVSGTCLPHQVLLYSAAWLSACWHHFPLVHWGEWKKLKYFALLFYSSPSSSPLYLLLSAVNLRLGR